MKKGLGLRVPRLAWLALALTLVAVVVGALVSAPAIEATTETRTTGTTTAQAQAAPGGSLILFTDNVDNGFTILTILPASIGKASFVANGGQSMVCKDKTSATDTSACDTDDTSGSIVVGLKVADDSPDGPILITSQGFGTAATDIEQAVLTVDSNRTPTSLSLVVADAGKAIDVDETTTATITLTLKNAAGNNLAQAHNVLVTTDRGVLNCGGGVSNVQQCSAAVTGTLDITLGPAGVTGPATITATLASHNLRATGTVIIYGAPKAITAAPQQGAIAIGGSTYVVVTVQDEGGNAVLGQTLAPTAITIKGPDGKAPGDRATAVGTSDLNVENNAAKSIPACGTDDTTPLDVDGTPTELFANEGTNAKGQCVVLVSATKTDMAETSAARGAYTVTVSLGADNDSDTATIQVGGPPASISSDAPSQVDPLSETEITVTVLDDEGVAVGAVPITIHKVEGAGIITTGATRADDTGTADVNEQTMTSDGEHKFTYLASRDGTVVFRVSAGTAPDNVVDLIEITIGDPEPPAPDAISMTLAAGGHFYAVPDGASTTAADLFGSAVNSAWKYNLATGAWSGYDGSSGRGGFMVNAGDVIYVDSDIDQTVGG